MKNLLALSLAFVLFAESLLPKGIGLSQDFKFGEMITHYQEHRDDFGTSFGFLDFLRMHYASESSHKKQNHHDKMPCLDGHTGVLALTLPIFTSFCSAEKLTSALAYAHHGDYVNTYHFLFTDDFLNPPKV